MIIQRLIHIWRACSCPVFPVYHIHSNQLKKKEKNKSPPNLSTKIFIHKISSLFLSTFFVPLLTTITLLIYLFIFLGMMPQIRQ